MSVPHPLSSDVPPRVDHVALPAGARIDRYEVLGVLGHGGFGITYLARDSRLEREVAIKEYLPTTLAVRQHGESVLRSTEAADDFGWGRNRFMEEGRTLASLHEVPSIVQVFDFLEANGTAYIVMERLRGETLEERVGQGGPLAPADLDAILWPLLDGLHKVHDAGFLHRDIKPANIVLGADGRATLIDFGASRLAMADRTRTMTAIFTPGYAAPEQFTSARQGPWTDIYGLAATLHFAITAEAPPSAFDRLMEDAYEPLTRVQPPGFPGSLLVGVDAGLALRLEERPQAIAGWRRLLRGESAGGDATVVMPTEKPAGSSPAAGPTPPTPPSAPTVLAVSPWRLAYRKWIALAAGAVLLAGASGYYAFAPTLTPQVAPSASETETPMAQPTKAETARPAPPPAEAAEAALKLDAADRQRVQLALTSLGFDTRGSDGAFGPRSREMIAAWQRANQHPATGYLTAAQHRALLRAAKRAPATEEETEIAVPLAPGAAAAPAVVPEPVPAVLYIGSLSGSATGGGSPSLAPIEADLRRDGRHLSGRLVHPVCGSLPVSLVVDAGGAISGDLRLHEAVGCTANVASATGRVGAASLTLDLRGVDVSYRGTLSSRAERMPGRPVSPSGQRTDVP
jgi:serine/threonine protein kinase